MSWIQVWFWCTESLNGRTNVQDEQRSGWPSTSTRDDKVCHMESLLQENQRIRLGDIANELNVLMGTVNNIVQKQLGTEVCTLGDEATHRSLGWDCLPLDAVP
ncbi:Uncharacterised protein r2_g1142 [Pycnogonum litorale]